MMECLVQIQCDVIRFYSSINIGLLVSHRLSKFGFEYNEAQTFVIMASSAAKCCRWVGRVLFFAALGFLAAYPAKYKDNSHWYAMSASYGPPAILWFCLILLGRTELFPLFFVWTMYIYCALLPNVIVIFGFVAESVSKEELLDPNVLKIMLCLTPLLLLLLVNTADNSHSSEERRELVSMLSVQMAIDLLDTVEMLDISLEDKEHKYDISKGFGIATLVVACLSFFLSPWQMAEIKFLRSQPSRRYRTTLARIIIEMIGVNLAFLIIRVLIFSLYGKDESIFIAKNAIAIILSSLEICHLVRSHR